MGHSLKNFIMICAQKCNRTRCWLRESTQKWPEAREFKQPKVHCDESTLLLKIQLLKTPSSAVIDATCLDADFTVVMTHELDVNYKECCRLLQCSWWVPSCMNSHACGHGGNVMQPRAHLNAHLRTTHELRPILLLHINLQSSELGGNASERTRCPRPLGGCVSRPSAAAPTATAPGLSLCLSVCPPNRGLSPSQSAESRDGGA